jgi:hypothetical protein
MRSSSVFVYLPMSTLDHASQEVIAIQPADRLRYRRSGGEFQRAPGGTSPSAITLAVGDVHGLVEAVLVVGGCAVVGSSFATWV